MIDARFGFSTVGSMLADPQAPQWLIKGILPQDSLAVAFGEPGHGKSFIAIDMAACVATGAEWHGHKTKPGSVFYIAGEGRHGLSMRFLAWSLARGISLQDVPLAVSTTPIALNDPDSGIRVKLAVNAMAEQLGREPALIVIDTLARNFAGDENSTKDMNDFIRALDYLRTDTGWQASILIVHHSGKDVSRGARGSSVLKAAVDTEYSCAMDENKFVAFQCHKMKDGTPPTPKAFQLKGVKLPFLDEDGAEVWSCAPMLMDGDYCAPKRGSQGRGKNQQLALTCLSALYREHEQRLEAKDLDPSTALVTLDDWRTRCDESGMNRKRFSEAKQSLVEQALIQLFPPHVRIA